MYDNVMERLSKSKFRGSFRLSEKDKNYVIDKGMDVIRKHAYDFVNNRLGPKIIVNDGKQTPMRGHPVFIAQHATGTCCRSCLYKWHRIDKNKELNLEEIDYVINLIILWIEKEISDKIVI